MPLFSISSDDRMIWYNLYKMKPSKDKISEQLGKTVYPYKDIAFIIVLCIIGALATTIAIKGAAQVIASLTN